MMEMVTKTSRMPNDNDKKKTPHIFGSKHVGEAMENARDCRNE
jgi:hypothetical protein